MLYTHLCINYYYIPFDSCTRSCIKSIMTLHYYFYAKRDLSLVPWIGGMYYPLISAVCPLSRRHVFVSTISSINLSAHSRARTGRRMFFDVSTYIITPRTPLSSVVAAQITTKAKIELEND